MVTPLNGRLMRLIREGEAAMGPAEPLGCSRGDKSAFSNPYLPISMPVDAFIGRQPMPVIKSTQFVVDVKVVGK